jgi:hypothetical protein
MKTTNKANGSSRLPAFSFRSRDAGDRRAGLRRARDEHAVATARRDDRTHAEVTRSQFYRCINPIRRGDREPVSGKAFPPSLTLFLLAYAGGKVSSARSEIARHFCGSWATAQVPRHGNIFCDGTGPMARLETCLAVSPCLWQLRPLSAFRLPEVAVAASIPGSAWQALRRAHSTTPR